jgi:hypothetical protein
MQATTTQKYLQKYKNIQQQTKYQVVRHPIKKYEIRGPKSC